MLVREVSRLGYMSLEDFEVGLPIIGLSFLTVLTVVREQILKQVDFVEPAHARQSSNKLGSALAKEQVSA